LETNTNPEDIEGFTQEDLEQIKQSFLEKIKDLETMKEHLEFFDSEENE